MITLSLLAVSICSYTLNRALNPLKLSITLMLMSSAAFFTMHNVSGTSWLPMLFFMLFMGGILIVFMIISSVMPNEKMLKSTKMDYLWIFFIMLLSLFGMHYSQANTFYSMQMKWLLNSNLNMALIVTLITIYFVIFVKLVSDEKMSLRSEMC